LRCAAGPDGRKEVVRVAWIDCEVRFRKSSGLGLSSNHDDLPDLQHLSAEDQKA
jgi:hypothetical protein